MTEDRELLPCPFCGESAEIDTNQSYLSIATGRRGRRVTVYCTRCNADMGVCVEDVPEIEPEAVIEMWNTRANWQKAKPDRELFREFKCECDECNRGLHHDVEAAYQKGREDEAVHNGYLEAKPDREMLKRFFYFSQQMEFPDYETPLDYEMIDQFLSQESQREAGEKVIDPE